MNISFRKIEENDNKELAELNKVLSLYERAGFRYIPAALSNSGHFGCNIWMLKELR
jgi:putative acetyltransferase